MSASFDSVNYAIRPNKNVERKLIFDALSMLEGHFKLSGYRYLGFGSMWFVDFVLAHQVLGIDKLESIERSKYARRARFNRPYASVKVLGGDSGSALRKMRLEQERSLIWLDYDGGLKAAVLEDLEFVCRTVPSGSVLIVTANARGPRGEPGHKERQWRELVGDLAPLLTPKGYFRETPDGFPLHMARALHDFLRRKTRLSRSVMGFESLFNICYQDTSLMVTVGGMIGTRSDRDLLKKSSVFDLEYVTRRRQYIIDVPVLTMREKLALDQLLPGPDCPTVRQVSRLGFDLPKARIKAYRKFYRQYPVFGEFEG